MAETTGGGWAAVNGWLDGLGGAVGAVGGIVNTVADGAEDVARGRSAIHQEKLAQERGELDLALDLAKFKRGDNVQLYWAGAAVAAAVIFLLVR